MAPRLELQALLVSLLGSSNVYFQPPPTIRMSYPAIRYELDTLDTRYANNNPYKHRKRYRLTVIDRDPDSTIPDAVAQLPLCSHDRYYAADDLNHNVFTIFF
jgi:hypothetical protein